MTVPPYISVVIVGRNDDYGVNFLTRLNTFVRSLDHQCRDHDGLLELVLVEWNPPADRAPLAEVVASTKSLDLSIITVPESLHLGLNPKSPMLEVHAKNVGARRARGEFVLITNPDILFTQQFIDFFAQRRLDKSLVYRTDRYDFNSQGIENQPVQDLIEFALSQTFEAHLSQGSVNTGPHQYLEHLPTSKVENFIHTNASGDFIMSARSNFDKVGGLVESSTQRWHLDSCSLIRFLHHGFRQAIIRSPACIFHQHHERKPPDVAWSVDMAARLGATTGDQDWGLGREQLTHTYL